MHLIQSGGIDSNMKSEDDFDTERNRHIVLLKVAELLRAWQIHDTEQVSQIRQELLGLGWDVTPSRSTMQRPYHGDQTTGPPKGW